MNVFEFAKDMEREGEKKKRKMAEDMEDEGLARICSMLADEEEKHLEWVKEMEQNTRPDISEKTEFVQKVKNVFENLDINAEKRKLDDRHPQLKLYKRAMDIESSSRDYYKAKSEESDDASVTRIFDRMAKEEESHRQIVESMYQVLTRPLPGNWLENAEWYHLEEY